MVLGRLIYITTSGWVRFPHDFRLQDVATPSIATEETLVQVHEDIWKGGRERGGRGGGG